MATPQTNEATAPRRAGGNRQTGSVIGKKIVKLAQDHPNWSYDRIAEKIRTMVKGAQTSAKSVASVVSTARADGVEIPDRRVARTH